MTISIIGTGHTPFGRLDESLYELLENAGKEALESSGVSGKDIGRIFVANYSAGSFNNQEHLGPYSLEISEDLKYTPAVRIENACASGSAAIQAAKDVLLSGAIDYALVVGVEKMTSLDTKGAMKALSKASYWPTEGAEGMTFPGLFAEFAKGYKDHYDLSDEELRETLAMIAAKNHQNATANDYAQMPWDCNYQEILDLADDKNPVIAEPLRLYDCSLITDGAAAVVLTRTDIAKENDHEAVEIMALSHVTDSLELAKRSNYEFTAGKMAVKAAYEEAGITVDDLDFAEVHDCFTIAELLAYETLGLTEDGQGRRAIEEGWTAVDGKLPVNLSGGLKAKGHPVGATGVSMAALAARQLNGNPIGLAANNPEIGLSFNIGGSAATNYAIVYRKI
ncbi:MAG: thiolase domain-containing protein [Halarsenatibacteraceae bacterium]